MNLLAAVAKVTLLINNVLNQVFDCNPVLHYCIEKGYEITISRRGILLLV